MDALLRYAIARWGEAVLSWTVRQLYEAISNDQALPVPGAPCVKRDPCGVQPLGYDLDPDQGVYFWELPRGEQ